MIDFSTYDLILASQSPRRSQILREAGFQFKVQPTDSDETIPEGMDLRTAPEYLATVKAEAALQWLANDQQIIVAADTVVLLDGKIYGKPQDEADAMAILSALSGKMHEVITGVCLLSKEKKVTFSDTAKVYFDEISTKEMAYYIQQHQPYDKAGAYAIQEWIGWCKIRKIEGTFANIMGLPMNLVYQYLLAFKNKNI